MVAYTYDANKNKTAETLSGVMQPYGYSSTTYDNENRLTAWNRTDGNKNQSWALSAAGDWNSFTENGTTQNRTHSAVHSLSTVDSTALAHDLKGNLTTNSNGQAYAWDFDNRMKSATVSGNTHGYAYDAFGRRVAKTVSDGTNTVTTVFVSDGQQEIAEYVGGTAASSPSRKFIYADYVDEPLAMLSGGNTYFYHQNNLYSVAALSDLAGNVVERYAYNAYGKPIICSGAGDVLTASSVGNPYLFTGRRLDSETGLQHSRARYYSFDLGRWLGRDPIGYGGGLNLYRYCSNKPTNKMDPTGLVIYVTDAQCAKDAEEGCTKQGKDVAYYFVCRFRYLNSGWDQCYYMCKDKPSPCDFYYEWCLWANERPAGDPGKGWRRGAPCSQCREECKRNNGKWPFSKCPMGGPNGPRWPGPNDNWKPVWPST